MKKIRVYLFQKKTFYFIGAAALILLIFFISMWVYLTSKAVNFTDPHSGIIVVDPGHGGIDGGTGRDGILEKEITLSISKKLKAHLEGRGYQIVMTRDEDVSLDSLNDSSTSRHQRDLNARADIINHHHAQLFLSIHVNCNFNRPSADGALVLYNERFMENKVLAYSVQRALNAMEVNGIKRTVHDPQPAKFFLLNHSEIPGVIVETAFISNDTEYRLLTGENFREQLAKAIADGVENYLREIGDS